MTIPDDVSPEDHLRELKRQEAELRERVDDLEAARRRRQIKHNTVGFFAGFIAALFNKPKPKQQPLDDLDSRDFG